jgi:hypothetical protein
MASEPHAAAHWGEHDAPYLGCVCQSMTAVFFSIADRTVVPGSLEKTMKA